MENQVGGGSTAFSGANCGAYRPASQSGEAGNLFELDVIRIERRIALTRQDNSKSFAYANREHREHHEISREDMVHRPKPKIAARQ